MRKTGISLVEIIIAVAILLAAMVPLWGLMGSSHKQVMRSADEIRASQLTIEILEQIENYIGIDDLPKTEDGDKIDEKPLNSMNGFILKEGCQPINVGYFDEYFMPNLSISSIPEYDNNPDNPKIIGRIVELELKYKSKEGKLSSYKLRGFASAK